MFYDIIKNEVKKMIDQEQAARTLINLIDVVHQENWVLLNNEDMASKTEEYYINFFKEHHLEEAIDEIKAVTEKNKSFFQRFVNHEEVDAKEMRDFMEPYRFIKSKYILKKCQISSTYCSIVRSDEKNPLLAIFTKQILAHLARS